MKISTPEIKDIVEWAYASKASQRHVLKTLKQRPPAGDAVSHEIPDGGRIFTTADAIHPNLLEKDAYFAGWSAVLACVNDLYAAGSEPLALMNCCGAVDAVQLTGMLRGMEEMASVHELHITGGHAHLNVSPYLAIFAWGTSLTNSSINTFQPGVGDVLFVITHTEGVSGTPHYPSWNSFYGYAPHEIRELYAALREMWTVTQGKMCLRDVSGGGLLAALMSFAEQYNIGMKVNVEILPRPENVTLEFWLKCFPSFSFIGACPFNTISRVEEICSRYGLNFAFLCELSLQSEVIIIWTNVEDVIFSKEKGDVFLAKE